MNDTRIHTRINDGLLGPLERPTLKWLAVHTPKWMNPDIYTTIGIAGSAIAFIGYLLSRYHPMYLWMATLGFIVNWIGDSMDGTLARYRHIERPIYGYFIDHITDSITAVLLFLGMGLSPYVSFNVASLALVGFLLMSVLVYLRTYVDGEFRLSYAMLAPTEARALAVLLNTAMFFFGRQLWHLKIPLPGNPAINPYDIFVGFIAVLMLYFFLTTAYKESIRLAKTPQ